MQIGKTLQTTVGYSQINKRKILVAKRVERRGFQTVKLVSSNIKWGQVIGEGGEKQKIV